LIWHLEPSHFSGPSAEVKKVNQKDKQPLRRGALGKGISSLLGESVQPEGGDDTSTSSAAFTRELSTRNAVEIVNLDPNLIDPNPAQPRKIFDENSLKELASSLKMDGFLQTIVVSQVRLLGVTSL
jgi:ParB family transcriptional regulator, chromosome partitioning protein